MDENQKDALQQNDNVADHVESTQEENVVDSTMETTENLDTVEVESDEHTETDVYEAEAKELPDFAHMPIAQLEIEAKKLLTQPVQDIKEEMDALHSAAMHHFDEERAEKLSAFIEEGGVEMDFSYDQPLRRSIVGLYKEYKNQRHLYYKKLEEDLTVNFEVKKAIIQSIKELPNQMGSGPEKYKLFRELQDRWKNTGPVPRIESDKLWKNYHHHVDNFYDFLRVSNELRELDFKKNLESKTELCVEAEELAEKDGDAETFKLLQKLHAKWKLIGPVDREHSEPMWERFSAATKLVHDKRHAYYESLRATREELIAKKQEIIDEISGLDLAGLKTHSAWQNTIKKVNQLRENYKNIGRINLPQNDELWEKFRELNKHFNLTKNEFYKTLKTKHQENLDKKRALLAKAEELKDSTEWRETANKLKRIQEDWKKIGYVPKSESDKIWKQFRAACNHFFNNLSNHNKELDKQFEGNYDLKKQLLEKIKAWQPTGEKKNEVNMLKEFIAEWKAIGKVPKANIDINNEFNKTLDEHFTKLKLDREEAALMRFENKLNALSDNDNSRQLIKEKELLQRKIDESVKELHQLENNIMFFANADEKNPIVKEANKNIERHKEQIALLKSKMKMLRKLKDN